jgi:hypothetical protein
VQLGAFARVGRAGAAPSAPGRGNCARRDIDCESHSDTIKIGSHSSVFICTRNTRSKSALPVIAGAATPDLARARATRVDVKK